MNRLEIKSYFDTFCKENKLEVSFYTYMYYLVEDLMNTKKNCNIIKIDDSIVPYYEYNKQFKFPYLPIVKGKIDNNYDNLVEQLIDKISTIDKTNKQKKITFVPLSIYEKLNTNRFKLKRNDCTFYYDTNDFLTLSGKHFTKLRWMYNKFAKEYSYPIVRKIEKKDEQQIAKLLEIWKIGAKQRLFRVFDTNSNRNWLKFIMSNESELIKQYNFCMEIDNKISAIISFNEPYPETIYDIPKRADAYIMKAEWNTYFGITEYVMIEAFREMNHLGYQEICYTGDLGMKNLHEFKQKMQPCQVPINYSLLID